MKRSIRFSLPATMAICLCILPSAWAQTPAKPQSADAEEARRAEEPRSTRLPTRAATKVTPRKITRTARAVPPSGDREQRPLVELDIVCDGKPLGTIVLELHPERTRATVQNFLKYVDEGFYNATIFHRVLPDFIIQGGGYTSLTQKKSDGLHPPIRNESRRAPKDERGLQNARGTVAMARKSDPHSAVAQFFINVVDNDQLDYPRAGIYGHCVFGHVIDGMAIVDKIKDAPTSVSPEAQRRFERYQADGTEVERAEKSQPLKPAMIKSARRLDRAEYEQRTAAKSDETAPREDLEERPEPEPEPSDESEPEDEPETAPGPGE